jgi:hypothetical protein
VASEGSGLLVIERILRDRHGIWQQVVEERELNVLTGRMLAASAIALACYGAVLGAFHSFLMALTSAVKLPLLFLVTLAICLPTLYLFNLVFGARLSVRQALAMVMVAITVTSMLAVAFAPISLFFLITAPDYAFFKLLNVAILALSAFVGLRFLTSGMQVLNDHGLLAPTAPAQPQGAPQGVPAEPQVPVLVTVGASNGDGAAPAVVPAPVSPAPVPAATPLAPAGAQHLPAPAGAQQSYHFPPGYRQPVPARVAPAGQRPASMTLLYIWILLFGFVGTQLAWTLRPFFGSRGLDFSFFRSIEGNFYAEILRTIANL